MPVILESNSEKGDLSAKIEDYIARGQMIPES